MPVQAYSTQLVVDELLRRDRHLLLCGEPGAGKSTLAAGLARTLAAEGRRLWCVSADPGFPAFGAPGAVSLARWRPEGWSPVDVEAICTLDAARFRLPLVSAVRRLLRREIDGPVVIDTAGVVRGAAAAELLAGLIDAAGADAAVVLARLGGVSALCTEIAAEGIRVLAMSAPPAARRPGKRQRARARTRLWDAYLRDATVVSLSLAETPTVGTPPPTDVAAAWIGRQCAVLEGKRTLALGEVVALEGERVRVRLPRGTARGERLLLRDARRDEGGLLTTAKPFGAAALVYLPPPDVRPHARFDDTGGPCPIARVGAATATLVNGVFGDPLLHLRLRHQRRSLLFDLGDGARLPARVAHQVSDVFVSHAHLDHIGGFLWLLRSRIGEFPACRLYGPPGLADNVEGLVRGVHWDRAGDNAPRFEVAEIHDRRMVRFEVRAGRGAARLIGERELNDGVLIEEPTLRVRAARLDHGTPVLAFALEQPQSLNVRKERLAAQGLPVGPWLTELKRLVAAGRGGAAVEVPGGRRLRADELASELLLIRPGPRLVYATDLADTHANRERLTRLARGAHTFFCEAPFVEADAAQAVRTGHLTARACGEIATAAGVIHLVPFHFSRRYAGAPQRVYDEVRAVCSRVVIPR